MKGLTQLRIPRTDITDDGLKHLKGQVNLRSLDLRQTDLSDEGVRMLREALPRCAITFP